MGNKHLMTGPKGNSEFCFRKTLNVAAPPYDTSVQFKLNRLGTAEHILTPEGGDGTGGSLKGI